MTDTLYSYGLMLDHFNTLCVGLEGLFLCSIECSVLTNLIWSLSVTFYLFLISSNVLIRLSFISDQLSDHMVLVARDLCYSSG